METQNTHLNKKDQIMHIIMEAVRYYLESSGDFWKDYECGKAEEGTCLSYDDLEHPSGKSVRALANEIEDDESWDEEHDNLYELKNFENEVFTDIIAEILTEKTGKDHFAYFDSDINAPYSGDQGAWTVLCSDI